MVVVVVVLPHVLMICATWTGKGRRLICGARETVVKTRALLLVAAGKELLLGGCGIAVLELMIVICV